MTRALRSPPPRPHESRELDDVIAIVSHDLRGPLSAMSLAVEALQDPALDLPTRDRYLAAMRRAIDRSERFLGDLLDVTRLDTGSLSIDPEAVSVASLLEEAARQHEEAAHDAGNWFVLEIPDGADRVMADRARVLQALGALIAHAIRHARHTGAVTLRAEAVPDAVRLWVIDGGPGLRPDEVDRVFERPWRRGDDRRSEGLGLAVARGIAQAHGGAARAVRTPGKGTALYLELPRAA